MKDFIPVKMLAGHLLAFMGGTQLTKKSQWKMSQPDDDFPENPVKI